MTNKFKGYLLLFAQIAMATYVKYKLEINLVLAAIIGTALLCISL